MNPTKEILGDRLSRGTENGKNFRQFAKKADKLVDDFWKDIPMRKGVNIIKKQENPFVYNMLKNMKRRTKNE